MPANAQTRPARQRILDTASTLFYRDGLQATGVDRIIAESGVAKMSFYRHFPSKADLIATCLQERHERWMDWFTAEVERRIDTSGAGLAAIADVLAEWFHQPGFRGCAFINAFAEKGAADTEEAAIAVEHKRQLKAWLEQQARARGFDQPTETAEAAMVAIEGAIVRAHMGEPEAATTACRRLLSGLGGRTDAT